MSPSRSAGSDRRGLRPTPWTLLSTALLLLGAMMTMVPVRPLMPLPGLDDAWAFGINAAVGAGLAFGRDLIFTFGPYAGIYTWFYHPATDGMVLAGTLLLAAALAAGLLDLTPRRGRWPAILLTLFLSQMWLRDGIFFTLSLLLVAAACREGRRGPAGHAALVLLSLSLALIPLVKGTFAAASGLALALTLGLLLLRGEWRAALAASLPFLLAMPALWLASGQALSDLPVFFLSQGEIIRGYTPAMGLEGPAWQVAVIVAGALLVLLLNLSALAGRGLAGLVLGLAAASLLFLSFKAGMVRQDGHIVIAGGTLALVAWILFLAIPEGRGRQGSAAALAIGLVAWAAMDRAATGAGPRIAALRLVEAAEGLAKGTAMRLRPGTLTAAYQERLAEIRRDHPLPPTAGPADIYSIGQSALLAHGVPWSPRPVLQSYSAYTPKLAALNAAHLLGPRAPNTVFLAMEPIDNRLAALEDGLSWPLLLTRYEAVGRRGALAVLRRRLEAVPVPAGLTEGVVGPPLPLSHHRFGDRVPLPSDPPALWARIGAAPTLTGQALNFLLRPPRLDITLHFPTGQSVTRRLIPGAAEAGFLIAPTVQDARQFLAFAASEPGIYDDQRPVAFTLSVAPGGEAAWQPDYALELSRFAAPAQPAARAALLAAPRTVDPLPEGGRCYLDTVNGVVVDHLRPLHLGASARLNGWGALLRPDLTEPTFLALALTAADGTTREFEVEVMPRPDVGRFFGRPDLVRIGFQALPDLSGLTGPHRLSINLIAGGLRQSCGLTGSPVTLGTTTGQGDN